MHCYIVSVLNIGLFQFSSKISVALVSVLFTPPLVNPISQQLSRWRMFLFTCFISLFFTLSEQYRSQIYSPPADYSELFTIKEDHNLTFDALQYFFDYEEILTGAAIMAGTLPDVGRISDLSAQLWCSAPDHLLCGGHCHHPGGGLLLSPVQAQQSVERSTSCCPEMEEGHLCP